MCRRAAPVKRGNSRIGSICFRMIGKNPTDFLHPCEKEMPLLDHP